MSEKPFPERRAALELLSDHPSDRLYPLLVASTSRGARYAAAPIVHPPEAAAAGHRTAVARPFEESQGVAVVLLDAAAAHIHPGEAIAAEHRPTVARLLVKCGGAGLVLRDSGAAHKDLGFLA